MIFGIFASFILRSPTLQQIMIMLARPSPRASRCWVGENRSLSCHARPS